ncbi:MAG: O-antigen ligase family protein [Myxococcaceae bacterium]
MVYLQHPLLAAPPHAEETADGSGWAWRPALAEVGLLVWGVGVQLSEALGALGMVLSLLAVLPPWPGWRARALRAWPLWGFILWCLVVPLVAGHVPTPGGAARILDWCFLPVAASALGQLGRPARRRLAMVVGAVFLLSCGAALCQHWGLWPVADTFARFRWTGLPFQRMYEPLPGEPTRYMAGGLLLHRLKFAHVGGLLVLAYLDVGLLRRNRAALALALAGALCVAWLPHARAASVALVVAMAVVLALRLSGRWRGWALVGVLLFGAGLLAGVGSLRVRFAQAATDEGSGDRRWLAQSAWRAVAEHPLAGVGLGRYHPALFASADTPEEVVRHAGKAHNQYLTLAAEAGVPAALLYVLVLAWCWRRVQPKWALGAAGRASVVFLALVSVLHDPLFHAEVSMAAVLALGLAQGMRAVDEGASA